MKRSRRKTRVTMSQRLLAWVLMIMLAALVWVVLETSAQAAYETVTAPLGRVPKAEGNGTQEKEKQSAARSDVRTMDPIPPWENEQMQHGYPWATITGFRVNLRTGPGTEYKSVAQWGVGTAVEVVRVEGSWAECLHWAHLGRTVWICTDYLEFVE